MHDSQSSVGLLQHSQQQCKRLASVSSQRRQSRTHNPNLSKVTGNPSSLCLRQRALCSICQPSDIGCLSRQAAQKHPGGHVGHSGQGGLGCTPEQRLCFPQDACNAANVRPLKDGKEKLQHRSITGNEPVRRYCWKDANQAILSFSERQPKQYIAWVCVMETPAGGGADLRVSFRPAGDLWGASSGAWRSWGLGALAA